jgi:magnesium transporter
VAAQSTPNMESMAEQVQLLLTARYIHSLKELLSRQHPADIADILEMLDDDARIQVFELLDHDFAAEVLDKTNADVTRDLVDAIPDETIADLLEAMPMDDAAEVLSELEDKRADDILKLMAPDEAADVEKLLSYEEGTAGRLMSTEVVQLKASWTVDQTINYLRKVDPDVETLAYLYVVNTRQKLVGVVPLRSLITAPANRKLTDFMETSVSAVRVDTDQEEVARIVSEYDYFAIPVVDLEGKLVGIITHDDVVDILQEEFTEDVQRMGGSEPLEDDYLSTPVTMIVSKRIRWLLAIFALELLTGIVLRTFAGQLESMIVLVMFIPLLVAMGGNSASQTTSTIIRAFEVGDVHVGDIGRILWHELRAGLVLGLVAALLAFGWSFLATGVLLTGAVMAVAILAIILWSHVLGALLPSLFVRLGIDPLIISGPVIGALVDVTGLIIYFLISNAFLGLV